MPSKKKLKKKIAKLEYKVKMLEEEKGCAERTLVSYQEAYRDLVNKYKTIRDKYKTTYTWNNEVTC